MKRISGILLAVCTALFIAVQTAFSAPVQTEWESLAEECFGYFTQQRGAEEFWDGLEPGAADWAAYCRARLYGGSGAEDYARTLERHVEELAAGGGFVRPTEYQRAAICISAAGGDPTMAAELGVYGCETLDRQGLNAYIWALIAVNVTGAQPMQPPVNTPESLAEHIISLQHADGSFSLMGEGGDVDITSAAVYALSGTDIPGALEAAQRGADWLCGLESYSSMGVRNCESTAQAVIALCAAGRNEKAQQAAVQLEEYHRQGGYAHLPEGGINQLATTQALEAFTAMALAQRGESLFAAPGEAPRSTQEISGDTPGSGESGGDTPDFTTENAAEAEQSAGDIHPESAAANGGKLTGTHLRIIISAVPGAAAAVCLVLFVVRRKKALLPASLLLAAVSGGVWLLDIRTPEEYYSQSSGGTLHVTVSADCSAALSRMDSIAEDVNPPEVIPKDGVVIAACEVSLPEGASAFDALTAAAREQRVRVDYSGSAYGAYIRSIGYICEFGFSETSGWMYRVNGEFPEVSASGYRLSEGDVVEFVYTCDLGRDVGDDFYTQNTADTPGDKAG